MIFDKYIALIIESIERHSALILTSTKEDNKILQSEISALGKELKDREALHEKILELEQENRLLEDSVEGIQEEFVSVSEKLEEAEKMNAELNKTLDSVEKQAVKLTEQLIGKDVLIESIQMELELAHTIQEQMEESMKEKDKRSKDILNDMGQQIDKIAQLERKVKDTEVALENAAERNTEAQAKQERLLQLVKEYDKATVSMLNAILERRSSIEERAIWEKAKEALKGWDSPVVKRKPGRPKKQS